MNLITRQQAPGSKSLPAELRAAPWQGTPSFALERLRNNLNRVQSRGGPVPSGLTRLTGIGQYPCEMTGTCVPVDPGGPSSSPFIDWNNIITVSSEAAARLLAASNPGTYYRDSNGVVYSQPLGSTQVLPVGGGYGASGSFTSPVGSGVFSGISGNTLMMVAVVGILALAVLKK